MENDNFIIVAFVAGVLLMALVFFATMEWQPVSFKKVGKYICEQHGYEFVKVVEPLHSDKFSFSVICKPNKNMTPIEGGYLWLTG